MNLVCQREKHNVNDGGKVGGDGILTAGGKIDLRRTNISSSVTGLLEDSVSVILLCLSFLSECDLILSYKKVLWRVGALGFTFQSISETQGVHQFRLF